MTIYRVNPVSGSNSNNGTSWGTAWKYLPGNGATINPGDEIRFAKSPERAPGKTFSVTNTGSVPTMTAATPAGMGYVIFSHGNVTNGGNVPGSTVSGARIIFPANTVIPPNTKLGYYPVGKTQNTLNSIEQVMELYGVPEGASGSYLKIVLCSDAAGNTPIVTLNGGIPANGPLSTEYTYAAFTYNSASTLNITFASIAIYSISGWTCQASGNTGVGLGPQMFFAPEQSTATYFPQGIVLSAPCLATTQPLAVYPTVYYAFRQVANADWIVTGDRRTAASANASVSFTGYDPMPFGLSSLYNVPLTFSGTLAQPIKITGGWNTSNDTQDGYTNLGIRDILYARRKAAFIFSAGGQYLEFERFLCHHTNLLWYDYAVGTLSSLKFTLCSWGGLNTLTYPYAGFAGFDAATNSTLTLSKLYADRCSFDGMLAVNRHIPHSVSNAGEVFAAGSVTLGDVDYIDCWVSHPFYSYFTHTDIKHTGYFNMYSSVGSSLRSAIVSPGSNTGGLTTLGSSPLAFTDVAFLCNSFILRAASLEGTATGSKLALTRCALTDQGDGSLQPTAMTLQYLESVSINGFVFRNAAPGQKPTQTVTLTYSANYWTANPSGPTISLTGPMGVNDSYTNAAHNGFNIIYPPASVGGVSGITRDTVSYASNNYIGITFTNTRNSINVTGFTGSFLSVVSDGVATPVYWPNVYTYTFTSCVTRPSASGVPLGAVRMIGGRIPDYNETGFDSYPVSNAPPRSSIADGIALYGVEVGDISPARVLNTTGKTSNPARMLASGVYGTGLTFQDLSGGQSNIDAQFHCTPESTLAAPTLSTTIYGPNGVLIRKPNGEFIFQAATHVAYTTSATPNAYGKLPIRFRGMLRLGSVAVVGGTLVTFGIRLRAEATGGFFLLIIPPCDAFSSGLNAHVLRKKYRDISEDMLISFTISPTASGIVRVNVGSSTPAALKDFTVSVA